MAHCPGHSSPRQRQTLLVVLFCAMLVAAVSANLYADLGVGRGASKQDVKRAFRRAALQYHPDKNTAPGAKEKFIAAQKAYAVLHDDEKRRYYDQFGVVPGDRDSGMGGGGGGGGSYGFHGGGGGGRRSYQNQYTYSHGGQNYRYQYHHRPPPQYGPIKSETKTATYGDARTMLNTPGRVFVVQIYSYKMPAAHQFAPFWEAFAKENKYIAEFFRCDDDNIARKLGISYYALPAVFLIADGVVWPHLGDLSLGSMTSSLHDLLDDVVPETLSTAHDITRWIRTAPPQKVPVLLSAPLDKWYIAKMLLLDYPEQIVVAEASLLQIQKFLSMHTCPTLVPQHHREAVLVFRGADGKYKSDFCSAEIRSASHAIAVSGVNPLVKNNLARRYPPLTYTSLMTTREILTQPGEHTLVAWVTFGWGPSAQHEQPWLPSMPTGFTFAMVNPSELRFVEYFAVRAPPKETKRIVLVAVRTTNTRHFKVYDGPPERGQVQAFLQRFVKVHPPVPGKKAYRSIRELFDEPRLPTTGIRYAKRIFTQYTYNVPWSAVGAFALLLVLFWRNPTTPPPSSPRRAQTATANPRRTSPEPEGDDAYRIVGRDESGLQWLRPEFVDANRTVSAEFPQFTLICFATAPVPLPRSVTADPKLLTVRARPGGDALWWGFMRERLGADYVFEGAAARYLMVRVAKQKCAVSPEGVDIGLWTGSVMDGTVSLSIPLPTLTAADTAPSPSSST